MWVADELRKAIELGYRVLELRIVLQYDITVYDQSTGRGGLFAKHVNLFLKIKQEASGWPSWCVDEASRARYVSEYEEGEGVKLEYEKIDRNRGLRAVAELCLKSFWGKFAQRDNQRLMSIVKTREKLLRLVLSSDKEVLDLLSVTDEAMFVTWSLREEAVISLPHTSAVIAAYVPAQARLKPCITMTIRVSLFATKPPLVSRCSSRRSTSLISSVFGRYDRPVGVNLKPGYVYHGVSVE